jgi:rubrerythrin
MDINAKNYNFNDVAFENKNSLDNIIYCPFCGVSSMYISNLDEVITVQNNPLNENTLKILDHAVKLELFNGDFYNTAARMAKSKDVKEMFQGLAKIEIFHSKIHQRLGGFSEVPNLRKINYDRYDSDKALLGLAKQKEKHAIEYYEKYKNEVYDNNLIKIFEALVEVEKDHIVLVEK